MINFSLRVLVQSVLGNCVEASQLELDINETLTERRVYKTLVDVCKTFSR